MSTNLDKLFEENVKNNIIQKNYRECINLLSMKIKGILKQKIYQKNNFFVTDSLDLMLEEGQNYLNENDLELLYKFHNAIRFTDDLQVRISKLLEIYKGLNYPKIDN